MAGIEAALCQHLPDGTWHDEDKLQFTALRDDRNAYYFYEANALDSEAGVQVSRKYNKEPHAAVLCKHSIFPVTHLLTWTSDTGLDSVQLEAWAPSVYVKTNGWVARPSEPVYTQLPQSNSAKQILYILHPDQLFRIGDREFVLQLRQRSFERDVQVMSSRPDDSNEEIRDDRHGPKPQSHSQPGTPRSGNGPTVMETPVTARHQPPLVADQQAGSRSQEASPTPAESPAVSNGGASGGEVDGLSNGHSDRQASAPALLSAKRAALPRNTEEPPFVPASFDEDPLSAANRDESSEIVDSSDDKSPGVDSFHKDRSGPPIPSNGRQGLKEIPQAQHNPRKRSASRNPDSEAPSAQNVSIVDFESAPGIDEESERGPPRKRQKRTKARRAVSKGADESQNSVRSTIHAEMPDIAPSLSPVADSLTNPVQEDNQAQESSKSSPSEEADYSTPRNHTKPTEPPSSNRSTRSTGQVEQKDGLSQKESLRVYYASSSTILSSIAYTRFLRQHNVTQVKNIADCDILCTGKGELKRTSSLILAVLMGKEIVTDQWVMQSAVKKQILDTAGFVPENATNWGTTLSDAIERGRRGLKPLEDWTINFTPSVKKELGKSWSELKEVCLFAGATVQAMIPRKGPGESDSTVVIAAPHEPDQSNLEERGWKLFSKDIITFSVLRGELDADSDEFAMKPTKKGGGRGRKKKA
ncbi:MAG: hypothetical protein L6R39_007189 [Caloplaca ligustica]|nr:MAG: hypothetical protein L6R39_007189 [Caloplaca ligustica]